MSAPALIIVDIQNDYFEGGKWTLHNMQQVSENAAKLLGSFRALNLPVFHVQHVFDGDNAPFFAANSQGVEIHNSVTPALAEPVFVKNTINPFVSTTLLQALKDKGIEDVVVIGAMSHMCIDATVRAAADLGFNVTVAEDACASRDLTFADKVVPATEVHAAYMSALGFAYANVTTSTEILADLSEKQVA